MKIVSDTNVLFAAFASPSGTCAACIESILEQHDLVLSAHILDELFEHLTGKRGLDERFVQQHVSFLATSAVMVEPAEVEAGLIEDVDDLPVLGTAVAGSADYLATGDRELLTLGRIASTTILAPRDLLKTLQTAP